MSGQLYISTSLLLALLATYVTNQGGDSNQSLAEKKSTAIACGPVAIAELDSLRYSNGGSEIYAATIQYSSINNDCTDEPTKELKEGNGPVKPARDKKHETASEVLTVT